MRRESRNVYASRVLLTWMAGPSYVEDLRDISRVTTPPSRRIRAGKHSNEGPWIGFSLVPMEDAQV
jgi:hypothetical protein